jgi:hypothetical protein
MTPLAQFLWRQVYAPERDRLPIWRNPDNAGYLRDCLRGAHCFDLTAVDPLIDELAQKFHDLSEAGQEGDLAASLTAGWFLPAPRTWLECRIDGARHAYHLQPHSEGASGDIMVTLFVRDGFYQIGVVREFTDTWTWLTSLPERAAKAALQRLGYCVPVVNSPRIVVQCSNPPHRGLAREMRQRRLPAPLAWTEIKLQVLKPREIDDGAPHEDQITGQRALHFVRRFIRIRLGKLEYVSAHWRGNPEIGIRQSRYVVTP